MSIKTSISVEADTTPAPVLVDIHDIKPGTFFSGEYGPYGGSINEGVFLRIFGGLVFFPIGDRGADTDSAGEITWAWDEDGSVANASRSIRKYQRFSKATLKLSR